MWQLVHIACSSTALYTTFINLIAFPGLLSGCLSLLTRLTHLNADPCCWLISLCSLQYYCSPAQLLWKAHIINITYSLLMQSTKIILLWSVKHCIIVFMLLFEALGPQPYSFCFWPKNTSLSSYTRNATIWVYLYSWLTICRLLIN